MPVAEKKHTCPDCGYCQMCSEGRCRLCRNKKTPSMRSLPLKGFTLYEYEKWQKMRAMKKIPVIDINE